VEADATPPPEGLTPHKLRHTFCSLLFANGHELPYVMDQLGHADINTTLRIYAHVMSHEDGERDRLRALINGNLPDGAGFLAPFWHQHRIARDREGRKAQRARQDLNLRPPAPEAGALSTELRARGPGA